MYGYPVQFGLRPGPAFYPAPRPRLGQAPQEPPAPSKPSIPVLLAAGAGGGALVGWAASVFVLPRLARSVPKGMPLWGTFGGGIGGLVGVATALLLKD